MGTELPRVFVVQEDPRKNVLSAERFGVLMPVLSASDQITLASQPWVRKIKTAMHGFNENDYVLAIGDPAAIGIACAFAAAETGGKFCMLKWDRQERRYYPVKVDLRKENNGQA
jgi:hypothetical protein